MRAQTMAETQHIAETYQPGLIGAQPRAPKAADKTRKFRRETGFPVGWLITPAAIWLLLFLVIPLISIIVFSLWTSTGHGMAPDLTLQSYGDYFQNEGFFDPSSDRFLTPSVFVMTLGSTFGTRATKPKRSDVKRSERIA